MSPADIASIASMSPASIAFVVFVILLTIVAAALFAVFLRLTIKELFFGRLTRRARKEGRGSPASLALEKLEPRNAPEDRHD